MPFGLDISTIVIATLLLIVLLVVFFSLLAYYAHRHWYYSKVILPRTKNWVILEIQMPKENSEDNSRDMRDEEKKQMIGVGEQLYTTLSGISHENWFWQPKDYISFEIACTNKKISFYINCPKHLQDLIEKQIQAQYPHAFIEVVKGYNPFPKKGEMEAVELQLNKPYMFPFRTYKNMETDPLNALTNAMSKLSETDGAAIQVILYPAGVHWQMKPRHMALEIQQGKNPNIVAKSATGRFVKEVGGGLKDSVVGGMKPSQEQMQQRNDLSGRYSAINLTPM
ncbi:TPA: hypothetical protein DCG61_00880, partial [Patescibacteria group bacterium]|nr:hypothetical protein [Patescibacteria group bacterium]